MTVYKVVRNRAEIASLPRAVRRDKPVTAPNLLLAGRQWQPRWPASAGDTINGSFCIGVFLCCMK